MQKLISGKEIEKSQIPVKRLFDIGTSVILMICFFPFFILFSLGIVIFSGRPIFFKQTRTGLYNQSFRIWKFRTMKVNNEGDDKCIYDWGKKVPNDFIFKTPDDNQVTRIGKIYRKLSIDELPQLLNVLMGQMSIVGPRPEIPEITKCYNDYQATRLKVKPGITGYAQINGRSEINHGEKIELDRYYIENYSFLLDLKIILKTIGQVIRGKGAY